MADPNDERVRSRARNPLPEEQVAGVDDPEAQAEAVLEESDERQFAAPDVPDANAHQTNGGSNPSK